MKVCGSSSTVLQSSRLPAGAKVTGEHASFGLVDVDGMSGRPVACPALSTQLTASSKLPIRNVPLPTMAKSFSHTVMKPLRASLGFTCESMKSTTSLRPPIPPLALMYLTAPFTPSTPSWNSPGAKELSTSATVAMWISFAVTPISESVGFSSAAPPTAGNRPMVAASTANATMARAVRVVGRTVPPEMSDV